MALACDSAAPSRHGPDAREASAAVDAGAPVAAASCEQTPVRRRLAGTALTVALQAQYGGKPLPFGEPASGPGGVVTTMNLRFYVSHLALIPRDGAPVDLDLLDDQGALLPYGVHLFNAEDDRSARLHTVAPPGDYVALAFTFGLDDACNAIEPAASVPPLTDSSQMTWPHLAGRLFLRFEAQIGGAPGDGGVAALDKIHMGGLVGLIAGPQIRAEAPITIPAKGAATATLQVSLDEIFRGAHLDADVSEVFPLPEVQAGERLRRNLSRVRVFVLAP